MRGKLGDRNGYNMRNIIVHEYFEVDEQKVWDTVANDISKLISECEIVLKETE